MKIRVLATGLFFLTVLGVQGAAAATLLVDDNNVECPAATFTSIQAAINAAGPGDTIQVCAGTYVEGTVFPVENLVLSKSLTLLGAQAGVDARGRVAASESIVRPFNPTVRTLELRTGSAFSIIDGFTFLGLPGANRGIESTSGPTDGLQLLNNRIVGYTDNGVFLNRDGINITVNQNDFDGTGKTSAGGLFHLDTDNFDGLWFTNNRVVNAITGTGFFVDGNRNVDMGSGRRPQFTGNFIDRNNTGVNLGVRAWGDGPIAGNTISNNNFDGLQGGPKNSLIEKNIFDRNGRNGLALTSFRNPLLGPDIDSTRGAQGNTISLNCFTGNGFAQAGAGIFFSAFQFPGTIASNKANDNNIVGNAMGARYPLPGTETIDATNNWWGAADGPGPPDGTGSGNGVDGHGQIDFVPFEPTGLTGTPCSGGPATMVTLDPPMGTNPVGTQHCVTATVTNAVGVPQQGVTVFFTVTGSVMTDGSMTTNANGQATFCYMGPALPGGDLITAVADANDDGDADLGEPSDTATKMWVLPVTTPGCEITITNGGWIIANNGDRASFGGNAKADEDANVSGQEEYRDHGPAEPFNLHGQPTVIVCDTSDSTRATIFGDATIDGAGSHTFRIDVQARAEPGKGMDRYRMQVDAYDSGEQTLQGGNVQIRRQ
jgi:hypothetical protein